METSVDILSKHIADMKLEGVVDIKLTPVRGEYTKEEAAKSLLALMDAPAVEDKEMF